MNYIIHPITNKSLSIFSVKGRNLLKNLIKSYNILKQKGGQEISYTPAQIEYIKYIDNAFDENVFLLDMFYDDYHTAKQDYLSNAISEEFFNNTLEQIKREIDNELDRFNPYDDLNILE